MYLTSSAFAFNVGGICSDRQTFEKFYEDLKSREVQVGVTLRYDQTEAVCSSSCIEVRNYRTEVSLFRKALGLILSGWRRLPWRHRM